MGKDCQDVEKRDIRIIDMKKHLTEQLCYDADMTIKHKLTLMVPKFWGRPTSYVPFYLLIS